ncbi:SGNH/GDSL hydrolase family protein [Devosia sp. Naph2]|uniref:SGNH/GDSL hydrolase family protein n=1 Tax=Devosia polycyclovorans TaxID=3345148 RepID=UPI0035D01EE1
MTNFQTAAQMTGQPYNSHFIILGDSRVDQCTYTATGPTIEAWPAIGHTNWLRFKTGQRIWWNGEVDNFGIAGEYSSEVLARTDAALAASDAAICIVLVSTNDRTNNRYPAYTAAETIGYLEQIRDKIIAAGRVCIFVAETPRGDTTYTAQRLTSPQLQYHMAVHDWLLSQRDVAGVYVGDPWPAMALASSSTGDAIVGKTADGLHQASLGARDMGNSLVDIINTIVPPVAILPSSNTDQYDATYFPEGCLNLNPMLTGTSGTVGSSSGATISGQLADSYSNAYQNVSGLTFAFSKVTDSDGVAWQQVAISGTAPASGNSTASVCRALPSTGRFTIGDVLEGVAEFEWDAGMTGVQGIGLQWNENTTGNSYIDMGGSSNGLLFATTADRGVMKTPKAAITEVNIRFSPTVQFINGATVSATIRFRAMGLRKVIA